MSKKETRKEKTHVETVTDKVGEIALHYGFVVIKPPHITADDISKSKPFRSLDHYNDVDEKVALTKWYINERLDLESQPLAIHYKKPLPGSPIKKKSNTEMYGLEVMGSNRSTSEALILKCTLAILSDLGYKDLSIDINSIGDRESIAKFERELNAHFRKHGHSLPAKTRQEFKKNHYSILKNTLAETKEFLQGAPQPVSALSEAGRLHFKEVLECIEAFNVPYRINSSVLSNKLYASLTVFEIRNSKDSTEIPTEEGEVLAHGYRYNHLAKKIGGKRDIPTIGVTITVKKDPRTGKKIIIKKLKKPRFYLIQLGSTAKLKVLNIVEMLRKQKIPVYHSITKDKITGQLNGAEYMKATHVLIMGQKEAIENSMVVRDVVSREQETVSVEVLGEFLKNIDTKRKKK